MNSGKITGIVLAGGKSSRMGENKSLMKLNGKTMIEFSIEALSPLCEEVVISSDHQVYDFTGCAVWPDEHKDQAPMVGIFSCLRKSKTDLNILLTCDMPMVSTELLEYLLANSGESDITVPVQENGMVEPLCGIYKKGALDILEKCIEEGNFRMTDCITRSSHRLVTIGGKSPFDRTNQFLNINTPRDFEALNDILNTLKEQ